MAVCVETPALQREARRLAEKTQKLRALFTKDEEGRYTMSASACEENRKLEAELVEENKAHQDQLNLARLEQRLGEDAQRLSEAPDRLGLDGGFKPAADGGRRPRAISLAEVLSQRDEIKRFKQRREGRDREGGVTINLDDITLAVVTSAAGFAPESTRVGIVVPTAVQMPKVEALIPHLPTTQSSIKFMKESTFTNNTAPTAENATKPENALAWTEAEQNVRKIAGSLPVTDEQLDDVPGLLGLIETRLALMLAIASETQFLTGDNTAPNLNGYLNLSGLLTQAKGGDNAADAIFKAITKVQATGYTDPTHVIMHPNDWQDLRLMQTADGTYIYGPPSDAGEPRIWGKPVIPTTRMTENTCLTGDFAGNSSIYEREGVTIKIGYVGDDFIKNRKTIVIERRVALVVFRDSAFCKVTGI